MTDHFIRVEPTRGKPKQLGKQGKVPRTGVPLGGNVLESCVDGAIGMGIREKKFFLGSRKGKC